MSTNPLLPIHDIIEGLANEAGTDAEFLRRMKAAGAGNLSPLTLRNWRNGSKPNRPRHVLALAELSGRSCRELLEASVPKSVQRGW